MEEDLHEFLDKISIVINGTQKHLPSVDFGIIYIKSIPLILAGNHGHLLKFHQVLDWGL